MSRIDNVFTRLCASGGKALVTYITAGDPQLTTTLPLMQQLVTAGADIIELGIPFSDPIADGPVIQRASERALRHNINLKQIFSIIEQFRSSNDFTPIILMGYLNPIEMMGYSTFAECAANCGVDGVITVDLPTEEAEHYLDALNKYSVAPIFLVAPTTSELRMPNICRCSRGFVYYVSLKGVTGAAHLALTSVAKKVAQIRQHTDLPVCVGFGVKDAQLAQKMGFIADGVVVGSAIVNRIEENKTSHKAILTETGSLVAELRQALEQ